MDELRLPWHRETVGHANIGEIAEQVARDLAVPLPDGIPPHTDATWIVNADNKIVAFVGNGSRQTHNADAIIAAVAEYGPLKQALRTALATVCICSPQGGEPHKDHCPIWRHGFLTARELLGIKR